MGVTIRSGREGKAKDQALNTPDPLGPANSHHVGTQTRHRRLLGSQEAGSLAFNSLPVYEPPQRSLLVQPD